MIKRQGAGVRETFTVRKQSFGVGVERTFPLHSPKIEKIEVAAIGDVNRAKLYYLRGKVGKKARVREVAYGRRVAAMAEPETRKLPRWRSRRPRSRGRAEAPVDAEAARSRPSRSKPRRSRAPSRSCSRREQRHRIYRWSAKAACSTRSSVARRSCVRSSGFSRPCVRRPAPS